MMRFSVLLAVFMAAAAQSQSTSGQSVTTSAASSDSASSGTHIAIFGAGATTIPVSGVAGSIVGVDSTATTIALSCLNDTSCAIGTEPYTLTQGPSTLVADIVTQADIEGNSGTISATVACNIISSTQAATCTATATISVGQGIAITTSITTAIPSSDINYEQLLITAGVEKLNSPSAHTSGGAAGLVAPPVPTGNMAIGVGGMAAAAVVAVAGML